MTINHIPLSDGQEVEATDQRVLVQVPAAGSATFETRESGSSSEFSALPVINLETGDRTASGAVGTGTYLVEALPNGRPTIRATGVAVTYAGISG